MPVIGGSSRQSGSVVRVSGVQNGPSWQVSKQVFVYPADAGSVTYTASVSGGIQTGGSALWSGSKSYLPTGTIQFGGSGSNLKIKIGQSSGGIVAAGSALTAKTKIGLVSGGLTASGVAATAKLKDFVPAGGVTLAGAADLAKTKAISGQGIVSLAGAAVLARTFAQGGSGSLTTSGAAATSFQSGAATEYAFDGTGGLSFSGIAETIAPAVEVVRSGSRRRSTRISWPEPRPVRVKTFSAVGSGFVSFGSAAAVTSMHSVRSFGGRIYKRGLTGSAASLPFDTYSIARAEDDWLLAA
jgi:hypothetical protein